MTKLPLRRRRASKAAKRQKCEDARSDDEQAADDESAEEQEQNVGDGVPGVADWVHLHQKKFEAFYITNGQPEKKWTLPNQNELYHEWTSNRWFMSLPARMQDVILYWETVSALMVPEDTTSVFEIFVDCLDSQ